jgi:hypothetical protein
MNFDPHDRLRAAFRRAYGGRYDRAGLEDRVLSAAAERRLRGERRRPPLALGTAAAAVLAVVVVGTLLTLGGLGRQRATPAPASSSAPAAAGSTPATEPPPMSSPGAAAAGTPRCHTADLKASIRALSPGAGQRYAAVDLTNTSRHECSVDGWVGLLLLDAGRHPLPTTAHWFAPTAPQPTPPIVLQPGDVAFAQLHWTVVPSLPDEQATNCLPAPAFLEVTPPDETTQLVIPWKLGAVCNHGTIDVMPLASGIGPQTA